jgi:hypothetical protein
LPKIFDVLQCSNSKSPITSLIVIR